MLELMVAEFSGQKKGRVSVIVRARDEAESIGRCLDLIRDQRTDGSPPETIIVDSGSRDGTAELARARGAQVIAIPSTPFSFGGALNAGAEQARGEIIVSLSAHAFPLDRDWLGRLVEPFSDPRVACASADRFLPDGRRLEARVVQDISLLHRHPQWGYSNGAGAFRTALWRERPFREDLPGCEDKEWASHWLERGYVCVMDPAFLVDHDHSHDPLAAIYGRARREAEGFASFLELPPYGPRELLAEWFSDLRFYDSPLRARLSHRRAARLLGTYAGRRRARRRGPGPP
jgi:rhamnosyltransferase